MTMIACSISIISTSAFITLWFWVANKELREKRNMVEAAICQLSASKEKYCCAKNGLEKSDAQEIFKRSQNICRQSVVIYNKTLIKPYNIVPALFLGFRKQSEENFIKLSK